MRTCLCPHAKGHMEKPAMSSDRENESRKMSRAVCFLDSASGQSTVLPSPSGVPPFSLLGLASVVIIRRARSGVVYLPVRRLLWRSVIRSTFWGRCPLGDGADKGWYRRVLHRSDTALLLPCRRVGFYPPGRRSTGNLMPPYNLSNVGVLPCAEPIGCAIRVSLQNLLGGDFPVTVDESRVVQAVKKIIRDLDMRQRSRT